MIEISFAHVRLCPFWQFPIIADILVLGFVTISLRHGLVRILLVTVGPLLRRVFIAHQSFRPHWIGITSVWNMLIRFPLILLGFCALQTITYVEKSHVFRIHTSGVWYELFGSVLVCLGLHASRLIHAIKEFHLAWCFIACLWHLSIEITIAPPRLHARG